MYAEQACGAALVPFSGVQGLTNRSIAEPRQVQIGQLLAGLGNSFPRGNSWRPVEHIALLDHMRQLAHIAGPVKFIDRTNFLRGGPPDRPAVFLREAMGK